MLRVGFLLAAVAGASGCGSPGDEMAKAVTSGDLAAVQRIAARHPGSVNAVVEINEFGWHSSVLNIAINKRRHAVARYLISKGARFDLGDGTGQLPLQAAVYNNDYAMTRLLLDAGAPTDARDHNGITALHLAASAGNRKLVELLLFHGANPSIRDKSGKTAAYYAHRHGYMDIVELLATRSELRTENRSRMDKQSREV